MTRSFLDDSAPASIVRFSACFTCVRVEVEGVAWREKQDLSGMHLADLIEPLQPHTGVSDLWWQHTRFSLPSPPHLTPTLSCSRSSNEISRQRIVGNSSDSQNTGLLPSQSDLKTLKCYTTNQISRHWVVAQPIRSHSKFLHYRSDLKTLDRHTANQISRHGNF